MMTSEGTNNNIPGLPLFTSSITNSSLHPLSSSPANNIFFQTGTTIPLTDDVTTIFVVGFPDDMTEREFQNMFMFCRGFEAASLKWHCKDQEDDNSVGSNGGKKQMIGFAKFRTRLEAMEAVDILGGKKVDQDKGTVLKAEMAKKNLHVKRGSVAPTSNILLPSSLLQQQQSSSSASSSVTTPPLTATTMIPGETSKSTTADTTTTTTTMESQDSTVDHPTTLSSPASSTPTSLGGKNSMVGEGTMSLLSRKLGRYPTNTSTSSTGSYDAFSPLPSDLLSPADYKTDPFLNEPFTCSSPTTSIFSDSLFGNLRSGSLDGRQQDIDLMSPPRHFGSLSGGGNMMGFNQGQQNNTTNTSFLMGPSSLAKSSNLSGLQQQQTYHYPPLQQQGLPPFPHHPYQTSSPFNNNMNEDDAYNYLSKSTPVSNDRLFGTSPLFEDMMTSRMGSLTMQATDLRSPSISSHRPSNPADQNPPCNTLYVGNLPPNSSEDELRQLFTQCRGYKRMCFRNKPQGPMCFVEFDDVMLATNALNEHQGHCLTTSVKGGIRLSYSKNPLFIKGGDGKSTTLDS
ncbi:hypothetical protein BC941DRAFT_512606 [Chlamydoabsidia padenii]|nr:hypothetical protein BC941DRAFT_512606 [Chlamydoabsidia padenii]